MYLTAVREDGSPGGKHRVKRPRLEDIGVVDLNKKMRATLNCHIIMYITAVTEDRSPGGKHRVKRPRLEDMGVIYCYVYYSCEGGQVSWW